MDKVLNCVFSVGGTENVINEYANVIILFLLSKTQNYMFLL